MPEYNLDGDTSGLPRTTRTGYVYELEPLSMRESWGAGNGVLNVNARQNTPLVAPWIQDMVGQVQIVAPSSTLVMTRFVPERYPGISGADRRLMHCSGVEMIGAGDIPVSGVGNFSNGLTKWPETKWRQYRCTFEAFPYKVLTDAQCDAITAAAGSYPGARELCRYIVRTRRSYSKEQPIPAGAAGFKDTTTGNKIGQVGFRVIEFAEVTYKWVRVPLGFPPPIGWTGFTFGNAWPPAVGLSAADTTKRRARDAYLNCVNNDWFDMAAPDGYAWPPGTLLYTGYDDSNRYYDACGDWVCDVTFNFKAKMGLDSAGSYGGWNYALNASGQWVYINLEGTAPPATPDTPPYKSVDFNNLFRYA